LVSHQYIAKLEHSLVSRNFVPLKIEVMSYHHSLAT